MEGLIHQFGLNWQLLIAQIINFTLLLLILKALLWKPIIAALDNRRDRIEKSLKHADDITEQKAKADAEIAKRLEEMHVRADEIIAQGKERASEEVKKILADAQEQAKKISASADKQIAKEREALYAEIRGHVVDLTIAATQKVLGEQPSLTSVNRAIDDSMAVLQKIPAQK